MQTQISFDFFTYAFWLHFCPPKWLLFRLCVVGAENPWIPAFIPFIVIVSRVLWPSRPRKIALGSLFWKVAMWKVAQLKILNGNVKCYHVHFVGIF